MKFAMKAVLFVVISFVVFKAGTMVGSQFVSGQKSLAAVKVIKKPAEESYDQKRKLVKSLAASLQVGQCFRDEKEIEAEEPFEKTYFYKGHVHVVMAKSEDAVMIAQPDPECKAPADKSHLCEYWFRTVKFEDPYLIDPWTKTIQCPKELSKNAMLNKLETSDYAKQYDLSYPKKGSEE